MHMSTLNKSFKKIYNFNPNGLAKFGTQNHQNVIDLLVCGLTHIEQN
jgi:hypothetical protein